MTRRPSPLPKTTSRLIQHIRPNTNCPCITQPPPPKHTPLLARRRCLLLLLQLLPQLLLPPRFGLVSWGLGVLLVVGASFFCVALGACRLQPLVQALKQLVTRGGRAWGDACVCWGGVAGGSEGGGWVSLG